VTQSLYDTSAVIRELPVLKMNKTQHGVRFLVLTAVTARITVHWYVTPFILTDNYQTTGTLRHIQYNFYLQNPDLYNT
jgi:hypothetical protein